MNNPPHVLVPLAQGCEELEAVTIIDLLRRANINVTTASLTQDPVTCARGTVIIADQHLDDVMKSNFDLIVLPGGLPGADNLNADKRIHTLISRMANEDKLVAAICAAPRVLLTNGILNGKKATAYPNSLSQLDTSNIQITQSAIETDGRVITSKGPGTAMDFALHLIEALLGEDTKREVEEPLYRMNNN